MASRRAHGIVNKPADEVWKVVADAGSISDWFPLIKYSEADGTRRVIVLEDDTRVEEQYSTDHDLRRFQYRIVAGDIPFESHLGTVDVIDLDDDRSVVVYSTEVMPDALGDVIGPATADAVVELARRLS